MLLQQSKAELSAAQAVIAQHQRQEKEELSAKRALSVQVEQLQNMLLLESGRAAQIQNSSEAELNAAMIKLDEQQQRFQEQLDSSVLRCLQVEEQLKVTAQEHELTRQALQEALRESSAAAAIEEHVKSKLATAQITINDLKTHQEQQLAAFTQERSELEQQLLQRDGALKQAQAQVAELRQR